MKIDPYHLPSQRLEQDGIVMKSGLTPTDMMILKGDFQKYDSAAASIALQCLAPNVSDALELIPDLVYELVMKRMYTKTLEGSFCNSSIRKKRCFSRMNI